MVFIDAYTDAVLITTIPVILVLVIFAFKNHEDKRGMYFIFGFLSITAFYIYAQDPSVVAALYTSQGNYTYPIAVASLASVFLIVAIFFFRRHLET